MTVLKKSFICRSPSISGNWPTANFFMICLLAALFLVLYFSDCTLHIKLLRQFCGKFFLHIDRALHLPSMARLREIIDSLNRPAPELPDVEDAVDTDGKRHNIFSA